MNFSTCQQYILACLRELPYMRRSVMLWLTQRKYGISADRFQLELYRLQYLGKVAIPQDADDCIVLHPQVRRNFAMLTAADVMREICGSSSPNLLRGTPPCILSFYLQDKRGFLDFKVVPVPLGREQLILEQLRCNYHGLKCTWLFLPEQHDQIEKLHTENPACFVFRNKAGGYDFLRKT